MDEMTGTHADVYRQMLNKGPVLEWMVAMITKRLNDVPLCEYPDWEVCRMCEVDLAPSDVKTIEDCSLEGMKSVLAVGMMADEFIPTEACWGVKDGRLFLAIRTK